LWNAVRGRPTPVLSGYDHNLQRLGRRDGTTQIVAAPVAARATGSTDMTPGSCLPPTESTGPCG